MAYIRQIEPSEASGDLAEFYDELVDVAGAVPNIVKLASLKPPAVRAAQDLYRSVLYHDSDLTMTQKEMVSTLVSAINGCGYCVDHHGAALDDQASTPGLAQQVTSDYRTAAIDFKTLALLEFAEKLTRHPSSMAEGDIDSLRSNGMSDEAILDLVQLIAYFNYTNRLATALGVDPED